MWRKKRKHWRNDPKKGEKSANLGTGKVHNFVVQQKISRVDKFQLKAFDQILDVFHLEYIEAVEKDIRNEELDCTCGVANTVLRGFDLLQEKMEEFGEKLGIKNSKQFNFKENWTIYLNHNQQ